ncbi:Transcriptional regulatory protein LevR, contains PRD, AAA+ and EIIA domains [Geosporobacter subterraneus DSM 17957]|uniref:Transcriptional regulatory protein LevR, contains PRD, AAA+ and EIIA domains n=1 Tax=Geosporobacter subterraneus DSM 17957 TaxID=1121919 RepID=A0A1M6CPY4_9FIRM|nr:PRD domain-containing protein [Geosporobacter subterraneus]SHI63072.1 Transcriptional regulatory protein LevR, contains PRD, AAA+ and EIIA domains [Geosporobacter subterraneus DSM 17957]
MKKIDEIYQTLLLLEERNPAGVFAFELGEVLKMDRANISRHLNELYKQNKLDRVEGRPVRYRSSASQAKTYIEKNPGKENSLDRMVGAAYSLQVSVQQAKAAVLYPPRGLHTLLLGETGVGKSMFAELMYKFALETNMIKPNAPFIRFNCADYADNPQLIVTQIFGVKKGAYTGADRDREGLLKQAEAKIYALKNKGMKEGEINQILNIDIDSHFERYIGNLPHKYRKDEIIKVVDKKIVDIVEEILTIAQKRLNKEYDEKIFFGLALHLHSSIERIRNRSKIYHPNLNFIRSNYVEEFLTAMEAAKWIDQIFQIETPLDEIGYLTMFLASDPYNLEGKEEGKVGLLLIMHGNSTASSMAQVANTLVGVDHAAALDMPLSMKPEVMYELAKESVIRLNEGKGVLLLVDMGSLTNFGEMIYEDTGIITKTIEAVSTPIAIDACRKAVMGRSLLEIYKSFKDSGAHGNTEYIKSNIKKKNIIITACFTGEGASEKLKQIIEEKLHIGDNLRIIPLNILNRKAFVQSIEGYRKEHNVLAIAGTIELHIDDIPFVSAGEILTGNGLKTLQDIIEGEEQYINMGKSIGEYLHGIDGERIIQETRQAAETIARSLQVQISNEVRIGIILHMIFLVDKLSSGGKETDFQELAIYREQFSRELLLVKESIKSLEASFGIDIGENELAYLCKMFLANHNK